MKRRIRRRRRGEEEEDDDDDTMSGGKCVPEIRCGLMPPSSGNAPVEEATHSSSVTRPLVDVTTTRTL